MPVVAEEMGNSLKFHPFWLKVFTLFDHLCWGMSPRPQRPSGLRAARTGRFLRALGAGQGPPGEPRGGVQPTSFANCQLLAGFALAGGNRSTCSPPVSGGAGSREVDIKGRLAQRPRGGGGEGAFGEVSPNMQLILT